MIQCLTVVKYRFELTKRKLFADNNRKLEVPAMLIQTLEKKRINITKFANIYKNYLLTIVQVLKNRTYSFIVKL